MRLVLDTPSSWVASDRPDGSLVFTVAASVDLVIEPIVKMPATAYKWRHNGLALYCNDGSAKELEAVEDKTELGWPIHIVDAEVSDGSAVIEHRLICFFRLLEFSCVATARASTRESLEACREELVAAFATARPSWKTDEVSSIHELWQGVEWS